MQFSNIAFTTQTPDAVGELNFQFIYTDQLQKRCLRVCCGYHPLGFDNLAIGQLHTVSGQTLVIGVHQDPLNPCRSTDFSTGCLYCGLKCFDQSSNTALLFSCHPVQHREHGMIGGSWCQFRADQSIPAEYPLQEVMIEILIHQVTGRQRSNPHEFTHIRFSEHTHTQTHTP